MFQSTAAEHNTEIRQLYTKLYSNYVQKTAIVHKIQQLLYKIQQLRTKYSNCTWNTAIVHEILQSYTKYSNCTQNTAIVHEIQRLRTEYTVLYFNNSLNSLEYQYSVHNCLLHLHHRTQLKIVNKRTFQRTLTHFIFIEQCTHFNAIYFRNEHEEQLCTFNR